MEMGTQISPMADTGAKTTIMCTNMPESLCDSTVAKSHFGRFGKVRKILLRPKKQMCIVEYDSPIAANKALLNAGAYDGFMFHVTWNKNKKIIQGKEKPAVKRRERKNDDPDWVPDEDVEQELNAMSAVPTYRQTRQSPMQQDKSSPQNTLRKFLKEGRTQASKHRDRPITQTTSTWSAPPITDSPAVLSVPTTMTTAEAIAELQQLKTRVSRTLDEQKRTLDARDRILRSWGGTGSRVKAGGAIIGTCLDMCPEKERLQRQVEHQVNLLECDGSRTEVTMCLWRAVKQYSRSSADQETPMCYELRPPGVLTMTMTYLLCEIADCAGSEQVSIADWFQFMWDRCRGIRKDIAQQASCCAESVRLVEQCARFHAHCAARLADLDHSQFDQRLNTDNLTKCLQTLKHMYADLPRESKPCEAEFRSYIALLNLGDANFCWEIKQLPQEIQKSEAIIFTVQIFMALDNNNYVRFFRLVRQKATYLQACILLRYFNDVRARGLARIVKAYAPRGRSKYPIQDLMDSLAFEDVKSLHRFIKHYGLEFSKHDEYEPSVILDRNQFVEDSDPYPVSRAISLIEIKRMQSVGEVIAGGRLPERSVYINHTVYTSFNENGTLKQSALLAEDLGYGTTNESNKDLNALKRELERTPDPSGFALKGFETKVIRSDPKSSFAKPNVFSVPKSGTQKFSFKPAIPVVSSDVVKSSPEKLFGQDTKAIFSFSKPDNTKSSHEDNSAIFGYPKMAPDLSFSKPKEMISQTNIFKQPEKPQSVFINKPISIFGEPQIKTSSTFSAISKDQSTFKSDQKTNTTSNIFSRGSSEVFPSDKFGSSESKFANTTDHPTNIFNSDIVNPNSDEGQNLFGKQTTNKTVFGQTALAQSVFGNKADVFTKTDSSKPDSKLIFGSSSNIFKNQITADSNIPQLNTATSPKTLFSSAINENLDAKKNVFGSTLFGENRVLSAAFGPLQHQQVISNDAKPEVNDQNLHIEMMRQQQEAEEKCRLEEMRIQEQQQRLHEQQVQEELRRQEEIRKKEELNKIQEKQRQELEKKIEEERRQAELKRLAEEKRILEEKRKIEEKEKLLSIINMESTELVEELINEINTETLKELMAQEIDEMTKLTNNVRILSDKLLNEVCYEMCSEVMSIEKFISEKLMRKYGRIWIANTDRNIRRRSIISDTPVWLSKLSIQEAAENLRRDVLPAALAKMSEFHKGNQFTGVVQPEEIYSPYNVIDIVQSSLLKGLKSIKVDYHDCYFWKISVSSPGYGKWLNRKLHLHEWLLQKFSDRDYEASSSIIYFKKQTWNNLLNFAVSISFIEPEENGESLEGSNGLLFYANEIDGLMDRIIEQFKLKRVKQLVPIAILVPCSDTTFIDQQLKSLLDNEIISNYKIINIAPEDVASALDRSTKKALKWLARNVPEPPPLELDTMRSILHRFVGMEFWYKLKLKRTTRMDSVYKDLNKLIHLYNCALDNLIKIVNDDHITDYPSFPNEMKLFLHEWTLFPKSYQFFPKDWDNAERLSKVTNVIKSLKLRQSNNLLYPIDAEDFQAQVKSFCNEIEWFENPSEVSCKIISHLPQELSDEKIGASDFTHYFEQFDFLDLISVAVVEKINKMSELNNEYVIYDKNKLNELRNSPWWYETDVVSGIKHKALDFTEDEIDEALNESFTRNSKRMRYHDSDDTFTLDDKDMTLFQENISKCNLEIKRLKDCKRVVDELEKQLEEETVKASNLEELLRAALYDD